MREILFRGFQPCENGTEKVFINGEWISGEWVEGYFAVFKGTYEIFVPFTEAEEKANEGHIFFAVGGLWYTILPETVGQYTGLTDKKGKKIFAGDIVKAPIYYDCGCYPHTENRTLTVNLPEIYAMRIDRECEIIGNVHSNPELLGGADNG